MANIGTFVEKMDFGSGLVLEVGTFDDSGGAGTGEITADTTQQPEIAEVLMAGASSDGDTAVDIAQDVLPSQVKVTCTANDTGKYWLIGKAA